MLFIMSRRQVVDLVWASVATFIALSLFGNAPDCVDALYRGDHSKDRHAPVQRERRDRRMTKAQKNMFMDRPSSSPTTTTAITMNENANRLWEAEYPKLYHEVACDCAVAFASDNEDCDLSAIGGDYSCRNRVMDLLVNRTYDEDDACTVVADQYPKVRSILPVVVCTVVFLNSVFIFLLSFSFLTITKFISIIYIVFVLSLLLVSFVSPQACGGCSCETVLNITFPYTCSSSNSSSSDTQVDTTGDDEECPCTHAVLTTEADGYMCGDRMNYLIDTQNNTELEACKQVGQVEFPTECGGCNPSRNTNTNC